MSFSSCVPWASTVAFPGLSSAGPVVVAHGLSYSAYVRSSRLQGSRLVSPALAGGIFLLSHQGSQRLSLDSTIDWGGGCGSLLKAAMSGAITWESYWPLPRGGDSVTQRVLREISSLPHESSPSSLAHLLLLVTWTQNWLCPGDQLLFNFLIR